mmetsp:Transcript_45439/g.108073  ORF Transcript_45439/g.108073 Transcript_45439/m.108073 type:complete len:204 (-) Transcript_45439:630-1241(-)
MAIVNLVESSPALQTCFSTLLLWQIKQDMPCGGSTGGILVPTPATKILSNRCNETRDRANDAKQSGKADKGARMALNRATAEKTRGASRVPPLRVKDAKVASETKVGATVTSTVLSAFTAASLHMAITSARLAATTCSAQRSSHCWSLTACLAFRIASVRRRRSSVTSAVFRCKVAKTLESCPCNNSKMIMVATPPRTDGPRE